MTYAHVGYITKFLWGQRRPPGDSEIEQLILSKYLIPYRIIFNRGHFRGAGQRCVPQDPAPGLVLGRRLDPGFPR